MSMAYVRETYNVPAKRGRLVRIWTYDTVYGWSISFEGRISSARKWIWIKSDEKTIGPFHPPYNVEYLSDTGETLLDTRERRAPPSRPLTFRPSSGPFLRRQKENGVKALEQRNEE